MAQTLSTIWKRYAGLTVGAESIPTLTEAQRTTVLDTITGATFNVGQAVRILTLTESEKSWTRAVAAEAGVSESRIRQHVGFWALLDTAGLGTGVDVDLYLSAQRWYESGNGEARGKVAAEIGTMGDRDAARIRFITEASTAYATKKAEQAKKRGATGPRGKKEETPRSANLSKEEQEKATVKVKHPLAQFAAHLKDAREALATYTLSEKEAEALADDIAALQEFIAGRVQVKEQAAA